MDTDVDLLIDSGKYVAVVGSKGPYVVGKHHEEDHMYSEDYVLLIIPCFSSFASSWKIYFSVSGPNDNPNTWRSIKDRILLTQFFLDMSSQELTCSYWQVSILPPMITCTVPIITPNHILWGFCFLFFCVFASCWNGEKFRHT